MTEPLTIEERAAAQVLCDKATPDPKLIRYDHGGGRSLLDGARGRTPIADYYNEADCEFYYAARFLLPRALATIAAVEAERDATIAELRKALAEADAAMPPAPPHRSYT